MKPFALAGSLLLCISCAHARDDEMTAAQHRNEAAIHKARANEEREKYDPAERRKVPYTNGDPQEWNARVYNPTQSSVESADREMRSASQHLAAARRLEAFEDKRCAEIPAEQRAACPLLASSVARVSETNEGILIELKPRVDAVSTYRMLDCHLAYATAQGFDQPSCPLFVKGMKMGLVMGNGAHWIAMSSDDPKVADQLREQARRIFGMQPRVSAAQNLRPNEP